MHQPEAAWIGPSRCIFAAARHEIKSTDENHSKNFGELIATFKLNICQFLHSTVGWEGLALLLTLHTRSPVENPGTFWGRVETEDVFLLAQKLDKLHFKVSIYIFLIWQGERNLPNSRAACQRLSVTYR